MFKLEIETDNAAFESDKAGEVVRILKRVAKWLECGVDERSIKDVNGNTVGKWELR